MHGVHAKWRDTRSHRTSWFTAFLQTRNPNLSHRDRALLVASVRHNRQQRSRHGNALERAVICDGTRARADVLEVDELVAKPADCNANRPFCCPTRPRIDRECASTGTIALSDRVTDVAGLVVRASPPIVSCELGARVASWSFYLLTSIIAGNPAPVVDEPRCSPVADRAKTHESDGPRLLYGVHAELVQSAFSRLGRETDYLIINHLFVRSFHCHGR